MSENTLKKKRGKKEVIIEADKKALAKPLTDEEKRLADLFVEGAARTAILPYFKEMKLRTSGHEGNASDRIAYGAVLDLCKTNHISAGLKIISNATSVRTSDSIDECWDSSLEQIASIGPQSYLEAMLVSQMIQVHDGATRCMYLAFLKGQTLDAKEMNANLAIKLQRTFVAQIEALQKLRGKGGPEGHSRARPCPQGRASNRRQCVTGGGGVIMETNLYPMPRVYCGAKTRSGGTCRQPAMKNGRCRLHGGKSLSGMAHGRYKHGLRTKEAIENRRRMVELLREVKAVLREVDTTQVSDD